MPVGQICARNVDTAEPDMPVQIAAQRMHDRKVGTLVICDPQHRPIGILTDRDVMVRTIAKQRDPIRTTVGEVMTEDPHCVSEDAPVESALARMREGPFRRLPVVDGHGALVGVVSLDEVLVQLGSELHQVIELVQQEWPTSLAKS